MAPSPSWRAALTALALLASAAAFANTVPGSPTGGSDLCRFNGSETRGRSFTSKSKECVFLENLDKRFSALRSAAGMKPEELILSTKLIPGKTDLAEESYNAFYDNHQVLMTRKFVECHADEPDTAVYIMAHEIGHAVQDREGILNDIWSLQEPMYRKDGDKWVLMEDKVGDHNDLNRRKEGQADYIGLDLLKRSDIPVPAVSAWEKLNNCAQGGADEFFSQHTHPSNAVRWVEAVKAQEQRAREEGLARNAKGALNLPKIPNDWLGLSAPDDFLGIAKPRRTEQAAPSDYTYDQNRYIPPKSLDWRALNSQGQLPTANTPSDVKRMIARGVPKPYAATPPNRQVALPGGLIWEIPAYVNQSPAEIIAYVTRGGDMPETVADAFNKGLDVLVRKQAWSLLPGSVRGQNDAANPSRSADPAKPLP